MNHRTVHCPSRTRPCWIQADRSCRGTKLRRYSRLLRLRSCHWWSFRCCCASTHSRCESRTNFLGLRSRYGSDGRQPIAHRKVVCATSGCTSRRCSCCCCRSCVLWIWSCYWSDGRQPIDNGSCFVCCSEENSGIIRILPSVAVNVLQHVGILYQ